MSEKRACVIGCSGFVGSHVTAELLSRGYHVHGTMRDTSDEKTGWLREEVAPRGQQGATLSLFSAQMDDAKAVKAAMEGCQSVFFCAGTEKRAPETIEIMLAGVRTALQSALSLGIKSAVITSSTGSTNPPGPEPNPKNELEHWSDPMQQISVGKFSPAAKTLMEALALRMMEESEGTLRICILNPSLIAGPCFQPEPVSSLKFLARIINKEVMAESIPKGSMSVIDVRDLAMLQVNALENEAAKGRYFGVKKSWSWLDILTTLADIAEEYTLPPGEPPTPDTPTQFDLSRQKELGTPARGLFEIFQSAYNDIKARGLL